MKPARGWAGRRAGVRGAAAMALLLAVLPAGLLAAQTGASVAARDTVNRLMVPQAVQERDRTTSRDDAAIVQALEHRIRCTCGCGLDVFTCRTTDFTCTTSPAMHRVVLARLDSNMTADQVVASFVAQYGESVLMQPPKKGFNWAAYIMPFVGLGVGIALVVALMRRWTAAARGAGLPDDGAVPGVPAGRPAGPPADDLARLQRELENFEA